MDVFSNTNTESVRQQEDKTSSGLFVMFNKEDRGKTSSQS